MRSEKESSYIFKQPAEIPSSYYASQQRTVSKSHSPKKTSRQYSLPSEFNSNHKILRNAGVSSTTTLGSVLKPSITDWMNSVSHDSKFQSHSIARSESYGDSLIFNRMPSIADSIMHKRTGSISEFTGVNGSQSQLEGGTATKISSIELPSSNSTEPRYKQLRERNLFIRTPTTSSPSLLKTPSSLNLSYSPCLSSPSCDVNKELSYEGVSNSPIQTQSEPNEQISESKTRVHLGFREKLEQPPSPELHKIPSSPLKSHTPQFWKRSFRTSFSTHLPTLTEDELMNAEEQKSLARFQHLYVQKIKSGQGMPNFDEKLRRRTKKDEIDELIDPKDSNLLAKRNKTFHIKEAIGELLKDLLNMKDKELIHKVHWLRKQPESFSPHNRIGATFTSLGKFALLYGGFEKSGPSAKHLFFYKYSSQSWKAVKAEGALQEGLAWHTAVSYKNFVYFFGGHAGISNLTNEVRILDVQTMKSTSHTPTGDPPVPRKNHAACSYESTMVVYGGINSAGKYLGDFWVMSFETLKWKKIEVVDEKYGKDTHLAYHTMVSILVNKKDATLGHKQKIKYEGFYVFGGKNQHGEASNTLKIITYDKNGLCFLYPDVKGHPPSPRSHHSCVYLPKKNILIIYGGQAGSSSSPMKRNNGSFVDTAILDLWDLNWVLVQLVGRNKIEPRVGHAAVASGTQMLVFGGVDENIYFDSGLRILETDLDAIQKIFTLNVKQIERSEVNQYELERMKLVAMYFSKQARELHRDQTDPSTSEENTKMNKTFVHSKFK